MGTVTARVTDAGGHTATVDVPYTVGTALKPRVGGLVVVSGGGTMNNGINHMLLRLLWKTIEPSDQTPHRYDWTTLDTALAALGPNQFLKVGVAAGGNAPDWLKALSGGAVSVVNTKDQVTALVPRWWTPIVQDRWAALQTAMAARYDTDPRVKQVIACESMTSYMEPFILGSDPASDQALFAAGLNATTQAAAIGTMLDATLAAWQQTRVELALHGTWEVPRSSGVLQQPWAVLRDWLNPYAAKYGERLMLTDYGLGPLDPIPDTTGQTLATATTQYGWMKLRGASGQGPVGYQITFGSSPGTQANYITTIKNAEALNGCYLETSGWGALTTAQRTQYDAELKTIAGI